MRRLEQYPDQTSAWSTTETVKDIGDALQQRIDAGVTEPGSAAALLGPVQRVDLDGAAPRPG